MSECHPIQVLLADKLVDEVQSELASLGCAVRNEPQISADDLPNHVADAEVLVVRSTRVTATTLKAAKHLSLVVRAGAGINTIDVGEASRLGVQVANCPGTNAAAVAELTIGLLIACDRRIVDAAVDLRAGKWRKKEYGKAHGLRGRTLGLLGFGAIAQAVAEAALGFGMQVIAWSRSLTDHVAEQHGITRADSPRDVVGCSDAVSVHLALVPETKHLVNAELLAAMRDGAIFLNTSRGELVDTQALQNAIAEKQLRVGLDVYENEPSSGDDAFDHTDLASMLTGTPHIGASTNQTSEAIGAEVVRIVREFIDQGRTENAVNVRSKSSAGTTMTVRHFNRVGVLAQVLEALRTENVNVEEMENAILDGGEAAVCSLRLDQAPSDKMVQALSQDSCILRISIH